MIFKKHVCDSCGRAFRKVEELMQHLQVAHESRQYVCEKCGVGFDGMEQMRDHAKKFHSYNKEVEGRKKSDGL
jgi:predicted nucleic acid-binding Zn ribbon protein